MTRILVTGSNGQLGRSIKEVASNYPEIQFIYKNSNKLNITNKKKVDEIFKTGAFEYCINCAAYTNVESAEKESVMAFSVNSEGVKNVAIACHQNNVTLLHISTDYVFDGQKTTPYRTTDKPNPINVYGQSKLQGELHIQRILKTYYIVRTSWLYSKFGRNFYNNILEKAKSVDLLRVTDDQTGCPTHAFNLAKYLLEIIVLDNKNYGIYHFSGGEVMTWYTFAQKILYENDLEEKVSLEKAKNYRTLAQRPKYSVLKSSS